MLRYGRNPALGALSFVDEGYIIHLGHMESAKSRFHDDA